jgi:murein L,D-transpeptidase YafK
MKTLLITTLLALTVTAQGQIKEVRVYKSERKLELINTDNQVYKTYKVMLGLNPIGAKTKEGDNKTPEGTYLLDIKNERSKFHKALHISYPTAKEAFKARIRGQNPGGNIMLHGLPNDFSEMRDWLVSKNMDKMSDESIRAALPNFDWTNGCIAVTDDEIEEIYSLLDVPTKIIISE